MYSFLVDNNSEHKKAKAVKPTLKSCSCPIHRLGEIKNSHQLAAGRKFFFAISLSKKIYDKKI